MHEITETLTRKPKGQKVYLLIHDASVIGVWTNLKHLCIDRSKVEPFVSYSKISKDIATLRHDGTEMPILEIVTKEGKVYKIQPEYLL